MSSTKTLRSDEEDCDVYCTVLGEEWAKRGMRGAREGINENVDRVKVK
jgi:hypothetical protein